MYSVVLSTILGLGTMSPDCWWHQQANAGYTGCATCAPAVVMPVGCGCSPCPTCGGMPAMGPSIMGGIAAPLPAMGQPIMGGIGAPLPAIAPPMGGFGTPLPPIDGLGTPLPPADGAVMPPAQLGETVAPPLNPPPALSETRTNANQAMIVVRLPSDAQLLAEHVPIPGSGPVRVFVSPALEPGRKYLYELTIEVNRGGKVLTDKRTVELEAGKTTNVTFVEPSAESPAPPPANPLPKTARINVRMPAGAALYVEGRPWAGSIVMTPPLDPRRTHYYQLTITVVRDGKPAFLTREVAFRAGQDVTVDFSDRAVAGNVAKMSRW